MTDVDALFERRHEVRRAASGTALVVEVGRDRASVIECSVRDVGDHSLALVPPEGSCGPAPDSVVLITREPGEWRLGRVGRSTLEEMVVLLFDRTTVA